MHLRFHSVSSYTFHLIFPSRASLILSISDSLSLFLPTIIAQLGYASYKAQLLTIPPYATAFLAIIFVAYGSHKTSKRGLWIILSGLVAIIGYAVILGTHTPGARYGGIFVAVIGVYSANGKYYPYSAPLPYALLNC